jgi:hypothetical protein
MAKSKATGYTDFYKGTSSTPGGKVNSTTSLGTKGSFKSRNEDEEETDPRKIAIKRRLKLQRAKKV